MGPRYSQEKFARRALYRMSHLRLLFGMSSSGAARLIELAPIPHGRLGRTQRAHCYVLDKDLRQWLEAEPCRARHLAIYRAAPFVNETDETHGSQPAVD